MHAACSGVGAAQGQSTLAHWGFERFQVWEAHRGRCAQAEWAANSASWDARG